MKRRWFVLYSCVSLLVTTTQASRVIAQEIDPLVLHVVNRLSFGASPGDYERVQAIGVDRYIQEQLNPAQLEAPQQLDKKLAKLPGLWLETKNLVQLFRAPENPLSPATKQQALNEAGQQVLNDGTQARFLRAVYSPRQLEEVMTDFWFNHFNVHSGKGRTKIWLSTYERDAIRPHVLGQFRDLLDTTARHPAMLFYLDNWQNTDKGLNENYARELMELHTLGVDGGYTQQDVITLAKVLTGWGIAPYNPNNPIDSGFFFNPKLHDNSPKQFLGQPLQQKGIREGDEALDILASHPSTAKFISYKLAQYFVSDRPSQALINRMQKRFLATDGDIREVLKTLFSSKEFRNPKIYRRKYKTPYQYTISAVRAAGVEVVNVGPLTSLLLQLSMPIYGCPTPDGYKQIQSAWLNPDGTVRRLSFAVGLGNGAVGIDVPANSKMRSLPVPIERLNQTIGPLLNASTQQRIQAQPENLQSGLMLGSPEFMYR
jgi:uncharacterized protein (DUF1800 family)